MWCVFSLDCIDVKWDKYETNPQKSKLTGCSYFDFNDSAASLLCFWYTLKYTLVNVSRT